MAEGRPEVVALENAIYLVDSVNNFPAKRPLLAHYTSLATLEKIAETRQLWLSHPYLMNDHQELIWAMEEGERLALSDKDLYAALGNWAGLFYEYLSKLSKDDALSYNLDIYIACFSEHDPRADADGVLSMWRAYGGNGGGAALIFDTAKVTAKEDSPFILAPVVYLSEDQRRDFIRGAISAVVQAIRAAASIDLDLLQDFAWVYYHRIRLFSLFTKNVGFSEENEWRLAYDPKRDDWDEYKKYMGHIITSHGIEPKLKIPLDSEDDPQLLKYEEVLKAVLLGPTASSALSVHSTKRMLLNVGSSRLSDSVRASGTPFRAR